MLDELAVKPTIRALLPMLILLCLSGSCLAQSGVVGWWKFDEGSGTSTADSSTYGNTGTLVNSPVWATGRVGPGALTFNGTTAYVNVPNTSGSLDNLQTTGMTVAAWIKVSGTGGAAAGRIMEKGGWFFAMASVGGSPVVRLTEQDSGGYRNSTTVALNTWIHVAATWDGGGSGNGIHLYVNGAAADGAANVGSGSPGTDVGSASIGNRASDLARGLSGSVDDLRVYNRVLSAAEIQTVADSTAPSAPSALTATATSSSQVNLSWSPSTDNVGVTGYLIERCQGASCSSFSPVTTVTTTNYSDTGRTASTSYSYRVRATDANSNLSSYSNTASATTPAGNGDTTPPSTPTGLTATAVFISQINLSWSASTDNVGVTGYQLERCQGDACSNFQPIASPRGTTYSDLGLMSNTSYTYHVRATDAANNLSPFSSPPLTVVTLFDSSSCIAP